MEEKGRNWPWCPGIYSNWKDCVRDLDVIVTSESEKEKAGVAGLCDVPCGAAAVFLLKLSFNQVALDRCFCERVSLHRSV